MMSKHDWVLKRMRLVFYYAYNGFICIIIVYTCWFWLLILIIENFVPKLFPGLRQLLWCKIKLVFWSFRISRILLFLSSIIITRVTFCFLLEVLIYFQFETYVFLNKYLFVTLCIQSYVNKIFQLIFKLNLDEINHEIVT